MYLNQFDLHGILEVVKDRAADYEEYVETGYECEEGEEVNEAQDRYYRFGYGDDLRQAVELIEYLIKQKSN